MSGIKTHTDSGLVRTLYGREPGEGHTLTRDVVGDALWTLLRVAMLGTIAFLLFGFMCGCSTPLSYRSADRSRFEAIAPEYDRYVDADPALSPEQKERRHRLTRAWDADSAGLDERPTTNGGGK